MCSNVILLYFYEIRIIIYYLILINENHCSVKFYDSICNNEVSTHWMRFYVIGDNTNRYWNIMHNILIPTVIELFQTCRVFEILYIVYTFYSGAYTKKIRGGWTPQPPCILSWFYYCRPLVFTRQIPTMVILVSQLGTYTIL